jgi:Uma2 family endonuclease
MIARDNIKGVPDLIVEISLPSTSKRDKGIKKKLYASVVCGNIGLLILKTK